MKDKINSGSPNHTNKIRNLSTTDMIAFRCVADLGIMQDLTVLDLGCGAGRSSRFLGSLGCDVIGVDTSVDALELAKQLDYDIEYVHVQPDRSLPFRSGKFEGVFSSWMLLEVGSKQNIVRILTECRRVIKDDGRMIVVTNTPEFYRYKWLSCKVNYPENDPPLLSGQPVKAMLLPEGQVVNDYFWTHHDYLDFFERAGFFLVESHRPLGRKDDILPWIDEVRYPPYIVYVLRASDAK